MKGGRGVPVLGSGPSVPVPPADRDDWRPRAACRDAPTELFYSEKWGAHGAATALSWCQVCLVRLDCLTWALTTGEPHGVWGGQTAVGRRRLLRAARGDVATVVGALETADRRRAGDAR